jgi:hypothetical protein
MRIELFLANTPNMRRVLTGCCGFTTCGSVIAFIQAQVLRRLCSELWTVDHDGLKGRRQ